MYPAHAQKIVRINNKLQKFDSMERGTRTNKAARTINYFTNGRAAARDFTDERADERHIDTEIDDLTDGRHIGTETRS
jgi:hypothetical protein